MSDKTRDRGKIWWLASYPKSGNTWVRVFLDAYLRGALNLNQMMMVTSDITPYYYHTVSPLSVEDIDIIDCIHLRPAALLHILQVNKQSPLILKTHNANIYAQKIPLIPPALTEGVIYVIRDPRDVVISWAGHIGVTYNEAIKSLEDEVSTITMSSTGLGHVLSSWNTHVDSYTNNKLEYKVGVVRYEDMLDNAEMVFRNVLTYLGLIIEEDKLKTAIEASSFKNLKELEEKHGFNEKKKQDKFFGRGTSGHWKKILTDKMVKRIESVHGEMMQKHGYELVS